MPPRALIIGIEHYPAATDLAQTIAGATDTAAGFFDWVTTVKKIAPADTFVCVQGGQFAGATRFGTERQAIVNAIAALVAAGQDQTDELFVYYSGHGYGFKESLERRAVDVLIASDYQDAASGGVQCLKLQEIQEKLYAILGGAHHYYFIDACRTLIAEDAIDPISLGRVLGRAAQRGRPTKYTLYSTAYGTAAAINSGFAPALLDGLHGKGHAKGFASGSFYVTFPLLCSYVQARIRSQQLDQNKDGNGDGYILQIVPSPEYTCTIEVQGAAPTDTFVATLAIAGNAAFRQEHPFTGPSCALRFTPGDFVLEVRSGSTPLERVDPLPAVALDFWDECRAVFRMPVAAPVGAPGVPTPVGVTPTPAPPPAAAPPAAGAVPPPAPAPGAPAAAAPAAAAPGTDATIALAALPNVQATATNLLTGDTHEIGADETHSVPAGVYEVTVRERGAAISRTVTTLAAGATRNVGGDPLDPVRASIVTAVGGDPASGVVSLSETLGPIANRDLGLWLTLMGASRIVADPGTFSKLRDLPLADVTRLAPDSTGVYVITTSSDSHVPHVAVAEREATVEAVPGLTGIFHALAPSSAGLQFVTLGVGPSMRTFVSYCLPNYLTLFVCSPGSRGQMRINQFILPMFHLAARIDPTIPDRLRGYDAPLRTVRTAYLFQAQFGSKRALVPVSAETDDAWNALLGGRWLDPIMSLVAGYEVLRRNDPPLKSSVRDNVVPALQQHFPGLPDIAAVAAQLGQPATMPPVAPLFREGLVSFDDWEDHLPVPAARLDFNHIWTAWRGAPRP